MNSTRLPYSDREAVPLYFYPFLSPLSHSAGPKEVEEFLWQFQKTRVFEGETLLYIHIPFCQNICYFCGFYRDALGKDPDVLTRHVATLKREIERYADKEYVQERQISAVYFGGGTPTILPPNLIEELLVSIHDNFPIQPGTELTFEGEVRTLKDKNRLKVLLQHGCTRVSFGVQTFNSRSRKLSGLKPTYDDIQECIENIQEFGYHINIDLMYGLPGQSSETWKKDIHKAIDLGCTNIDIYDTVLYPHTILFRRRHKLKDELPAKNDRMQMLEAAINILTESGYVQETIEDFTKPTHAYLMKKLVYGGGDGRSEIIALGASAVGLINGFSYRNLPPADYLEWSNGRKPLPIQLLYELSADDFNKRALVFSPKVLGLHKKDVDTNWLENYRPVIEGMKSRGLLIESETSIKPTKKGQLWTDNIAVEFLNSTEQKRIWKIGH